MVEINTQSFDADAAVDNYLTTPKEPRPPASAMRVVMPAAMDKNPDETAELKKISDRTGVPMSSLEDPKNRKTVEKNFTLDTFNFDSYAAAFPNSAQLLADPDMAAIAYDDAETLGGVESSVKFLGDSGKAIGSGLFWEGVGHRLWGALGWSAQTISTYATGPIDEGLYQLGGQRGGFDFFDDIANFALRQSRGSEAINQQVMNDVSQDRGRIGRGFMSGMNSIGATGPGVLASVVTRNPQIGLGYMGASQFGGTAEQGLEAGLDPLAAGMYALRDAGIEVGTEMIPLGKFIGDLNAGTGIGKTILTNIGLEVPGELLATTLQNFNDWATLNPDEPFQTYLDQLPSDLVDTVIATVSAAGVQTGAITVTTRGLEKASQKITQAQGAIQTADALEQLQQLAAASKTLQRDTDSFERWVESMSEDSDFTDVYLDTEELAQSGVDLEALAEVSPSVAKQLDTALNTGSLLRIPLSEYTATVAPSELGQSLLDFAKTDPQGMNRREAEEFMQNGMEELQKEVEQELEKSVEKREKSASRVNVEQNILQQLARANRFTEDVNKPYATLLGHFYETMGQRTGQTAEQLFQQYPVAIQSQDVVEPEQTLDQDQTVENFAEELKKTPGVKTLNLYNSRGALKLDTLIVDKEQRKQGVGSNVMQEIVDFADKNNMRVVLSPAVQDDFQGTTSRKRLVNFYKRFGFVENKGRKKDFTISEGMYREPQSELNQGPVDTSSANFKKWAGGEDVRVLEPEEVNDFDFANTEGPVVVKAFHGTTHSFDVFDASIRGNKDNQFGAVNYFTTDMNDATGNYAGEGPDLTIRIDRRAEQLQDKLLDQFAEKGREKVLQALYRKLGSLDFVSARVADMDDTDAAYEAGKAIARKELAGGDEQVMEVFVRMDKPFVVGGETQWLEMQDSEALEEEAIQRVSEYHNISEEEVRNNRDEYEDEIDEARWDIEADTESPLFSAIETVALENDLDPQELAGAIYDLGSKFTSDQLEQFLRDSEQFAYAEDPETGDLIGFQLLSEVIEALGYDSIILKNADQRFKTMNIQPGTAHIQIFDANNTNIKSVDNQGTFDPNDPNIYHQERRGSFNPQTSTITLLKAADLSTFLHESGHFFLETLGKMASDPNAPQQVKDDMDTALKWMGVESLEDWQSRSLEEQRDAHEQFARGFEAYLFEGTAPNVELQTLFQRFRDWLVNIYRDLRNLNVELNDEVRKVFDRLLATDEVIREAEDIRAMAPMFNTAEEAGMTADEWEQYQRLGSEATAQAKQDLDARSLRDMKWLSNAKSKEIKRLQKDARQKRANVRAEVEFEVMAEPVNQAYQFITKGEYLIPEKANKRQRRMATEIAEGGQSTKMSLESLRETYGETDQIWQGLPTGKYGLVAKDGMDFNVIAELFGYSSGDQMLQQILTRENPKEKIEALTDQRMLERYGDISDPVSLERAADAAVHNDARTRFVASEMAALQKAVGGRKILAKAAKQLADAMISRLRIRDLKPSRYTAAEAKAGRAADKARRDGDLQTAAVQKRNQLVQLYAAKAAITAQEQNQKDLRYLKKFDREGSRKNIDPDYLDQIDAILARFDLKKSTSLKEIDKRKSFAVWLDEQHDMGFEPDVPEELLNSTYTKHYKDMTVEEMRGLVDTIKQVEHLGRLKKKLLTLKDQRELSKVIEDLTDSIYANSKGKAIDNTVRATKADRVKRLFKGFLAQHRKIASLSREMDGVQDGGPMWEVFIRTMNEAGDREAVMREEATMKLTEIAAPVQKLGKMGGKGVFFPSLNRNLNREERLAIVLNMGNEGNMQRLLDGKGWTREQLQPVIDSLTAEEAKFVQQVWDVFESYRPQIAAKEKRIYGKEPEWVEPTPLETPHGELRGGYFPIKYDTRQSAEAAQYDAAEQAKQQLRGAYTSATTRRSFTKTRAEQVVDRPLLLTMDAMYGGLNDVIHDLSWHEWLIDANRLLRSKRLSKAILETQGAEVLDQYKEAIKDIAAGEMAWSGSFERVSAHLRQGATIAGLGLSISTSIINLTGFSQSLVRVGPRWAMQGLGEWVRDPINLTRQIQEKSDFMRLRAKTMQREINEVQSMLRDKPTWRQIMDTAAYTLLTMTQLVVDTPTWWGAYQKALANGETEGRAVAMADQAVIDAQGGGQVKDLAEIQRSKVGKLFTVFYSYFSTTYQLTVEQTSKTNFKDPMDVLRLANDYFLLYALPAALGALIRSAISGDDDWAEPENLARAYANEQLSFVMSPLVGLREFTPAAQKLFGTSDYNFGYSGPASLRFYNEGDRFAQQLGQGELDKALLRAGINFGGIMLHLPSAQTNRTIDGMIAIMDGETYNPAALVFGPPK